jgi:hypothetical protein
MKGYVFLIGGLFAAGLVVTACKRNGPAPDLSASVAAVSEIDEAKVSALTGVPIKVLKTDTIGFSPINRFYWIRIQGRPIKGKLLEVSKAILDKVIAAKPHVHHSFSLHFISSDDYRSGAASNKCFAKATFLPEGDWQKVGRDPIDGYANYKLDCVKAEQR